MVKNPPANAGDARHMGSIPGSGRSPGEGNGKPLQYSCLEIPWIRGAWWAMAHGVDRVGHDLATKQHHYDQRSGEEVSATHARLAPSASSVTQ